MVYFWHLRPTSCVLSSGVSSPPLSSLFSPLLLLSYSNVFFFFTPKKKEKEKKDPDLILNTYLTLILHPPYPQSPLFPSFPLLSPRPQLFVPFKLKRLVEFPERTASNNFVLLCLGRIEGERRAGEWRESWRGEERGRCWGEGLMDGWWNDRLRGKGKGSGIRAEGWWNEDLNVSDCGAVMNVWWWWE